MSFERASHVLSNRIIGWLNVTFEAPIIWFLVFHYTSCRIEGLYAYPTSEVVYSPTSERSLTWVNLGTLGSEKVGCVILEYTQCPWVTYKDGLACIKTSNISSLPVIWYTYFILSSL